MTARDLRGVFFFAIGAFAVFGPIYTQVLFRPGRTAEKPWLPMSWQMYHGIGVNMCQAELMDAEKKPLPSDAVQRAVGPTRHSRYTIIRRARAHDVTFVEAELPDITRTLCARFPDVRADMRCSPDLPGGKWRTVHDGSVNLCTTSTKRPAIDRAAEPEVGD